MDLSVIRQQLSKMVKKRERYIFSLVNERPMVHGLPHKVFRKCGKENCRCAKGDKHGPYPALSVNKSGKQKIVMVKKADRDTVLREARRYKYFQETLAKIRRLNKEIDELLEKVKHHRTKSYP